MILLPITPEGLKGMEASRSESPVPEIIEATRALYTSRGYIAPWGGYLAVFEDAIVGTCGFKSAPCGGEVEIAYSTFPKYQGRGHATTMARVLLDIAANDPHVTAVTAQTLPRESPSTSILRRLGFILEQTLEHPEDGTVWHWKWTRGKP